MVMIPKSEAYKWRLIAMLCTLCRVWAGRGGEDVSTWMKSLKRPWISNGLGCASQQAAYDIALSAEAAYTDTDNVHVTIMDDREKGFEKVRHQTLCERAEVYFFPPERN